ncbi:hypothetical protein [Pseudanabaena yagii]|uniref:Uncharacterized protein n=1 Tax=Pseudanabaena yagii GIHE-NHR1 TaxID=2722753 RepID=A0ABX1LVA8_9CYAN|nr:hypothetical protein [Pseudanabaena yagii]NMF60098.1 hypothetical protein [Pseudanabaena yagii GIHE-NHR1]
MNLNETQKRVLRWLVEEVRAENLDEEEIWFSWTVNGTLLGGYKGNSDIPQVKTTTLDALAASGFLICDRSVSNIYKCALTGTAYEAVGSNITQNIGNKTNKLSEKIGVVAQSGSVVNIGTLNVDGNKTIKKQVNVDQSGTNNTQNNTFNL